MMDKRMQLPLRQIVDTYLSNGWDITERCPLTMERGQTAVHVDNGVIKDGKKRR